MPDLVQLLFHMGCISIVRSSCFKIFSASFLITLLSPGIATSTDMQVPFLLSRIMTSGLLLETVLSVRTCWFHNMVSLPSWLVGLILVYGRTSIECPIRLLLLLLSSSTSLLSSSSSSPLCRVFILIFLTQTMSLGNKMLQLFCCYYSRCLYR